MRAFDFDATVWVLAASADRQERARARRNQDALARNNAQRRALGLPEERAPLA